MHCLFNVVLKMLLLLPWLKIPPSPVITSRTIVQFLVYVLCQNWSSKPSLNSWMVMSLDLSVTFDTIDHDSFLKRLSSWVGICGTPMTWFKSYLISMPMIRFDTQLYVPLAHQNAVWAFEWLNNCLNDVANGWQPTNLS